MFMPIVFTDRHCVEPIHCRRIGLLLESIDSISLETVMFRSVRCTHWLLAPLSLALSHKGRGEVLFECIEHFPSGRGIKLFVRAGA